MQKNFIIFIVIAIVLIGGVAFYKTGSAPTVENPNPGSTTTSQGSETINPGQNTGNTTTTGTQTGTNKTFTLAEVTAKNSKAACWSIVNGSVYDLTNWIGKHPGGQKAITQICGKDGSGEFNGQHGGQKQPESVLASYKIGTLAK